LPTPLQHAKIRRMSSYSVTEKLSHTFELGPIRPPSEAYSLLIRVTRNCPWNRCQFCPVYKGSKFGLRSVKEIIRDIEAAKAISEGIKELAWKMGHGNRVSEVAATLYNQPQRGQCVHNVALWLGTRGKSAFLQDSNTLIMRTPELTQVITFLRKTFPSLNRVTTYGRSHTAARKSLTELKELKDAGLDRIHIGLETDYIRLRSLHVPPSIPLWTRVQNGDFELQTEDEIVKEITVFIENLQVTSHLKSDHTLNLLMEVKGRMPEDKEKCLDIINGYLSLPDEERLNFKFGRRTGYYNRLADLGDIYKHDKVEQAIKNFRARGISVEEMILRLKHSFI
jgi:hypothetical protein